MKFNTEFYYITFTWIPSGPRYKSFEMMEGIRVGSDKVKNRVSWTFWDSIKATGTHYQRDRLNGMCERVSIFILPDRMPHLSKDDISLEYRDCGIFEEIMVYMRNKKLGKLLE